MIRNPYLLKVIDDLSLRNANQPEYLQAVKVILDSLDDFVTNNPMIEKYAIIERLVEPERIVSFRVTWVDDQGKIQVNRGYRVQHSSLVGPYKGGIRFHPSVNLSTMKFLAFEQTFKNALTGLPMGGAKGGSDFNPSNRSDGEIMRFCQNFMLELYRHIGDDTDVPAGDIGVGAREIGYMYGMYKKIQNKMNGTMTGKGIPYGGSLVRKEATGYGLCYFVEEMLRQYRCDTFAGKKVIISGVGNVSSYAAVKAKELGAIVVGMSNSQGCIYDPNGIDIEAMFNAKRQGNFSKLYHEQYPNVIYSNNAKDLWKIKADIALPCAIQNEIDLEDAKNIVASGVFLVAEGANMPCTAEAEQYFLQNHILFAPGKAANAGGVAVSLLEMSQNASFVPWEFSIVDAKLKDIMEDIFKKSYIAAKTYKNEYDLISGANIVAFIRLCEAMIAQGIV